jgi:glycosyltransferase involved in cell wall biosynthesis
VDRIYRHAARAGHEMERCFFDSREWKEAGAPCSAEQALRLFYNPAARARFDAAAHTHHSEVALFHNLYPVASPALYRAAVKARLPVMQYLHNFRPFSVSGTLYAKGQMMPEALTGDYRQEILHASWQGSVLKSALFAMMLKGLHASRWLDSVKSWIAISEFMRQRMIGAGLPAERVHALRHSWDAMPAAPAVVDGGRYLFLGRLVEEKGLHILLQAWQLLRQRLGSACPALDIAGEGPLLPEVLAAEGVRYLGQLDAEAKADALTQCRALVIPSTWWEPLGLVTYEAYDFGKPVLAAASGGLTETVQPGVTGWLHSARDADELAANVLACESASADQRAQMGRAGRSWLLRETSPVAWQARFSELVARVV